MGSKHKGLKTSREIHDRIQWDASLDERAFTLVYEERFTGRRSRAFVEFPTDGEIPWHRVWEYRVGELLVWSREQRVDLLFGSGDTPRPQLDEVRAAIVRWQAAATAAATMPAAEPSMAPLEALASWRYDHEADAWAAVPLGGGGPLVRPRSIVVVTLNVLFDLYDEGALHTARRIPAMLELLAESGADLIALQEVTPRSLAAVLEAPWVRRGYAVSDGPTAATVAPYGVVLLSRLGVRAWLRRAVDGGRKRTVLATVELAQGPLHVAVVHLTSDRGQDAATRRPRELAQVLRDLDGLPPAPALLLGDLNADEGPLDRTLHAAGFVDLWTALRPDEDGATFDPHTNPLARLASRSGRARRLDRIMLRPGAPPRLRALDVTRLGTRPTASDAENRPLPVSDHYGLRARLRVDESPLVEPRPPSFRPTHHSAVVVVPPRATWAAIEAIRRVHDPAASRWMPHVSLLYGFAPAAELAAAARAVMALVAEVPPFRVVLERLRWFPRRGGATVWLEPRCDPPDALTRLQAALFAAFLQCDEQSRKSARGFTPHLTVGRLREPDVEATVARWQAAWTPISFTVDALAIIHRGERGPFTVQAVAKLGGGPRASVPLERPASHVKVLGSLSRAWEELVEAAAPMRPALWVAGSHRLGVAEPDADLDLVGVAPRRIARAELLERLPARLRAHGIDVRARVVEGAAPRLALRVDGRAVDLQHVAWPDEQRWPATAAELVAAPGLDAESQVAVRALADAEALLEHAVRHGGRERQRAALRALRRWAAARDVDDNALGYPGGLAWAVMLADAAAAVPCDPTDEDPARTLLTACLRRLASRSADDWRCDPIALVPLEPEAAARAPAGSMVVLAPTGDAASGSLVDTMRRATATTRRVLMVELRRAVAGLERGATVAELSTPIEPEQEHPWLLELELAAPDEHALEELEGLVRGRAAALVRGLERARPADAPALRPYALVRAPTHVGLAPRSRLVIGIDAPPGSPPELPAEPLRELEAAVAAWPRRPAGATVRGTLRPSAGAR